jgi:hypothetical protein
MKASNLLATAANLALAAVVLNGCSGAASQFAPAAGSPPQSVASRTPVTGSSRTVDPMTENVNLYETYPCGMNCWCTYYEGTNPPTEVSVYCRQWPFSPWGGDWDTATSTLYTGQATEIVASKYIKGSFTQVGTLTGLSGNPIGIATDSKGDVWATNSPSATISEFAKGATTPSASYTDSNLTSASYLAIDKQDNLYVEGQAASGIEIDELPAGGTTFTAISQPGQLGAAAGGEAVQQHGKDTYVWVNDQGAGSGTGTISRYLLKGAALTSTGSFGYSGINGAITVDPSGKDTEHVYAANNVPSGSEYNTSIVEYALSSGSVVSSSPTATSSYEAVGIVSSTKL